MDIDNNQKMNQEQQSAQNNSGVTTKPMQKNSKKGDTASTGNLVTEIKKISGLVNGVDKYWKSLIAVATGIVFLANILLYSFNIGFFHNGYCVPIRYIEIPNLMELSLSSICIMFICIGAVALYISTPLLCKHLKKCIKRAKNRIIELKVVSNIAVVLLNEKSHVYTEYITGVAAVNTMPLLIILIGVFSLLSIFIPLRWKYIVDPREFWIYMLAIMLALLFWWSLKRYSKKNKKGAVMFVVWITVLCVFGATWFGEYTANHLDVQLPVFSISKDTAEQMEMINTGEGTLFAAVYETKTGFVACPCTVTLNANCTQWQITSLDNTYWYYTKGENTVYIFASYKPPQERTCETESPVTNARVDICISSTS